LQFNHKNAVWHYKIKRKMQHATSAVGEKKKNRNIVSGWIAELFIVYKLLAPLNQVPHASGKKMEGKHVSY
jgi:hypothetical protein